MSDAKFPPAPSRGPSRRALLAGGAAAAVLGLGGCAMIPSRARIEAENPPVGAFVTAKGLRVHHVALGRADAPPVVLIHGATGNLNDMTFDLGPRLAERYRVLAFDRPGLGWSERPAREGWRPAVQAAILREAAARLGAERPVVVGHSWGGAVAAAWALQAPDIPGAVIVSGATMPWGAGDAWWTPLKTSAPAAWLGATALRAAALDDGGASAAARIFRPEAVPRGYLAHLQPELLLRPASFRHNLEDIERLDGALAAQARDYPELRPRLQILHAEDDGIVSAQVHAQGLAMVAPRIDLALFGKGGHMLHHARPEAVEAAVDRVFPS